MQTAAQTSLAAKPTFLNSKAATWTGRALSGGIGAFLIFDGVMKVIRNPHIVAASADLGFSTNTIAGIGCLLLACTLLYVIPRTAILGAVLLTGYLGGAVAVEVRVGHPVFQYLLPVIFGVLLWAGNFLRDPELRQMIPLRKG
jgi:DoxX-like family